jgi:hypothetical protein
MGGRAMITGTMKFSLDSIINGKIVRDMTDAEKTSFIAAQAIKGRAVIIEGFNDGKTKEKAVSEGGQMIVNNTIVQKSDDPDYWTRLEHQYAGMAMQGLCANSEWDDSTWEIMAEDAISAAHALVQKIKEERK